MTVTADQFLEWCYAFKVPVNGQGGGGGSSASVSVATTANLSGVYDNGASGIGATITLSSVGSFSIDGVTPPVSSRVLVKDQTNTAENGVYTVTVNDALSQGVLTRATNYDTSSEINSFGLIVVQSGTTQTGEAFYLTAQVSNIGTSPIVYAPYSLGVTSINSNGTINVSSPVGNVTLTLPQSIATTATPTFNTVLLANLSAHGAAVVASDNTLTSVIPGPTGNVLTSDGTDWVSVTPEGPTLIPNDTVMSNISGASAVASANTMSDILDATITATPNSVALRNSTEWTGVQELPASMIPIDHYSLNVQYGKPFLDYNLTSTGLFPAQMVAFRRFVSVINNLSETLQTFQILASGIVNPVSTVATGGNPTAIVYFFLEGADCIAVTNAADDTFQVYQWNGTTFNPLGAAISTIALSPRGIAFNVITGTPCLTVAGYISNIVQLFTWNGTTFIPASSGVSTGTAPGSAVGFDYSGTSYLAVVNTTQATTSIYTYVGSDWLIFQTVSTNSTPLSLKMFNFKSVLYLAVACSIGDSIEMWKLSGGTFVAAGSTTSAGIPVSIDQFELNGVCYISVVGTLTSSLRTYIYDPVLNTLTQDGSETATRGITPADMVAYKLINSDGSYSQYISVTNSLSNNMTTFYYADGLISVAPILTGNILSNLSTGTDVPIGNTLSDILDFTVTDVQGSLLTRTATGWDSIAPGTSGDYLQSQGAGADLIWAAGGGGSTTIANNELLANISGITAPATGVTFSGYLDSAVSSTPYSLLLRDLTTWGNLAPEAFRGLICDYFGAVKYVEQFPTSFIPVDNTSIIAEEPYGFEAYAAAIATSTSPTQMAFFSISPSLNYVSVISTGSNNVKTYLINNGTVTLTDTTGTGNLPSAIAVGVISGTTYAGITNQSDNTVRFYYWDTGVLSWIALAGGDIFVTASLPKGISFSVLSGNPTFTVSGSASNTIVRCVWNGTTFSPSGGGIATGTGPTLSNTYTFSGTDYLAVANSTVSSISVYTWSGTAWVLAQTITTSTNPVDVEFFTSGANLFLAVACKTSDAINVFKLVTGTFTAAGSITPANSPSGISHVTINSIDFLAVTGTTGNTLDTYIYSPDLGALALVDSISCGGTNPGGLVSYTVNSLPLVTVSNTSSNTITTFEFFAGGIALAPIGNKQILSNISGASAKPVGVGFSALFDSCFGNTPGTIIARDFFSGWVGVPPGTSGRFLMTSGSSGPPSWQEVRGLVNFINATGIDGVTSYNISSVAIEATSAAVLSIKTQTSAVFITSYVITAGNILVNFSGTITGGEVTVVISA